MSYIYIYIYMTLVT